MYVYVCAQFREDAAPGDIVAAFKRAEANELRVVRELRSKNSRKDPRAHQHHTFCVCLKRQYGLMTQCELCNDWFHGTSPAPTLSSSVACKTCDASLIGENNLII